MEAFDYSPRRAAQEHQAGDQFPVPVPQLQRDLNAKAVSHNGDVFYPGVIDNDGGVVCESLNGQIGPVRWILGRSVARVVPVQAIVTGLKGWDQIFPDMTFTEQPITEQQWRPDATALVEDPGSVRTANRPFLQRLVSEPLQGSWRVRILSLSHPVRLRMGTS